MIEEKESSAKASASVSLDLVSSPIAIASH